MTTFQMQPISHFGISATEDLMEVTSDMDRCSGADGDIDIDIYITGGNQQDGEDEYMEENVDESVDHALANEEDMREASDDGMVDESYAWSVAEQASVPDEDIEDADCTGPAVDEDTIVETTFEQLSDPSQNPDSQDQITGTQNRDHEYHTQQTTDLDSAFISENVLDGQQKSTATNQEISGLPTQLSSHEQNQDLDLRENAGHDQSQHSDVEALKSVEGENEESGYTQDYAILPTGNEPSDIEEVESKQREGNEVPAAPLEEIAKAPSIIEEAQIEELATGQDNLDSSPLHPVLVGYQDNTFFLFPPIGQDEEHSKAYFLPDKRLADDSISNILGAFRSVLGGNISEHDNLTISIDTLDLDISEVSLSSSLLEYMLLTFQQSCPESSTTTLAQLIDIYVHLQQYDGLEPPPPFYINLTSTSRFARRLEYLINAVAEEKGLSQIQSFEVAEADQQYDPEEEPGLGLEDDTNLSELPETSQVGFLERNGRGEDLPAGNDPQGNPLLQPGPSQAFEPLDFTKHDEDQGKDNSAAQPDVDSNKEGVTNIDSAGSKVAPTGEAVAASSPPFTTNEEQTQVLDETTVDYGDIVDYEDDEGLAHATSSRSSTLQGDVLEVTIEQDHSETSRLTAEGQKLQLSSGTQDATKQEEKASHSGVDGHDATIAADAHSVGPSNAAKVDLEYPNYPKDDNAGSSDEVLEDEEKYAEDGQDATNLQMDHLEPSGNANKDRDTIPGQQKGDSVSYENERPQEQAHLETEDHNPQDGENLDEDKEGQHSSPPIEDEYDFGHASPHEEETALEDLKQEDQPAESDMRPADAVNDNTENATPEPPTVENIVEQSQHDSDEITYEDEDDVDAPQAPSQAVRSIASSPGSIKRVRSFDEEDLQGELLPFETKVKDDGVLIAFAAGAKRVRSG
jgi:hypothetical protein